MAIPNRYYRFAEIALQLADEKNNKITHRLCALIVKRNRVLAIGYNSNKTHPRSRTKMVSTHAEFDAILRCADDDIRGADLVVVRCKRSGLPGLAKPCHVCQNLIRKVGIRRVYYTTNAREIKLEVMG